MLAPLIRMTKRGWAVGRGTQYWPWILLDDEVRAIRHIIDNEIAGPVNLTGPARATANDLGRAVAHELHRPFWLPAPAWALRLCPECGSGRFTALADADVRPVVLEESGFVSPTPTVREAVAAALA